MCIRGLQCPRISNNGLLLRHKDGVANEKNPTISNIDSDKSNSIKSFFGIILIIIGLPMSIIGLIWMMDDTYVVTQMAGIIVLFIGMPIFGSGCGLLIWNQVEKD